jgi:hypothetical protein
MKNKSNFVFHNKKNNYICALKSVQIFKNEIANEVICIVFLHNHGS